MTETENDISLTQEKEPEQNVPPKPPVPPKLVRLQSRVMKPKGNVSPTGSIDLCEDDARMSSSTCDQLHRKAIKKGINFTIMVVGESGLGKSTFICSLLNSPEFYKPKETDSDIIQDENIPRQRRTTTICEKRCIQMDERGMKLFLTIIDTPGFMDPINSSKCIAPIEAYVDNTFEQFFRDECGLNRKNIRDFRIHCCLYFISPYAHGLRPMDIEFIRRLQHKVNIVPVIAKADTFTEKELMTFKKRIMQDIELHGLETYELPLCDSDEEDEIKQQEKQIRAILPFSIIGSNTWIETESRGKVRGRQYPWGLVELENSNHCDFNKLKLFLLKSHMQDLKDVMKEVHYENYRAKYITDRISQRHISARYKGPFPSTLLPGENTRMDISEGFHAIASADGLLKQKEEELQRMQAMIEKMQNQLKLQNSSS